METKYTPKEIEKKWYKNWMDHHFFHSTPDSREAYAVVIPPPNVTGVLHMGHMLNNTIQDVLVRRARMQGKNVCWVPGMDHASIATEAKVVAMLKANGIDKKDLTREEFLKHAWQWKEKYGGIILEQLKKLGASCDWERTRFTMDDGFYESVQDVFIDLYNRGLIYRGVRMVNWDPVALTAVSDEEVIYKEVNSKLYYLRYPLIEKENEYVVIATTRPETILGDTAVCVNPNDPRYEFLEGMHLRVPLVNREIPVIRDEYVDMEFGTGCLKVTPAHDINDYNLGLKYKLDTIDIFNDNGTVNDKVGMYVGMDRFKVRKKIVQDLKDAGFLEKEEDYQNKVGYSERTDVVIEPKLSLQWFLKMEDLAKPALEVVMNDQIKFYPAKVKNTYRHWMENIRDWCISRQLWWGHRIPAYYLPNKEVVVAKSKAEALALARQKYTEASAYTEADLVQDEDVLDTWFSSWLWPMGVFDGIRHPDNEEVNYYYPTADLVTAPDILFFWVARMIMIGLDYRKEVPFRNVYFTGIVRDKLGRKMSKSLGNSPDPLDLIERYGADGVRMGMLLTSPVGNDLPFDESICEQGRNFCNKIWNALRLMKGWEVVDQPTPKTSEIAGDWFEAKLRSTLSQVEESYKKYRLSDALMGIYKLVWDDFCSWYLEMIKPPYGEPIDRTTHARAIGFMEELMGALHPFMPFITEEIWHLLQPGREQESIMFRSSELRDFDARWLTEFEKAEKVIMAIRTVRNEKNIPNKTALEVSVKRGQGESSLMDGLICKLCNISAWHIVDHKVEKAVAQVVDKTEIFVHLSEDIDVEAEIAKAEKEIEYLQGFLLSVEKKLQNEKFVQSAPEKVVAAERKKKQDAEQKIEVLKNFMAQNR